MFRTFTISECDAIHSQCLSEHRRVQFIFKLAIPPHLIFILQLLFSTKQAKKLSTTSITTRRLRKDVHHIHNTKCLRLHPLQRQHRLTTSKLPPGTSPQSSTSNRPTSAAAPLQKATTAPANSTHTLPTPSQANVHKLCRKKSWNN